MLGYSVSVSLFLFGVVGFVGGWWTLNEGVSLYIEWVMVSFNSLDLSVVFYFDWMSLVFASVVLLISSMVMFYSMEYMSNEVYMDRFVYLVLLFIFSMLFFIFSPSLISMMLGWDGLGLISYLLIVFYQNSSSSGAGLLTILMNRVGDVGLLFSIGWLFSYGSWNFMFFNLSGEMILVAFLVLLASLTKSAQIPFSSWLPAAMAAPTPVSALVHSSTLVTAGVYLLIRLQWALGELVYLKFILLAVSVMTMFFSGMVALFENDLKRVIALSTLSQLGLMVFIVGLGRFDIGFFHLLTHALFKSLMFMCAGKMIHDLKGVQDLRFMGGLYLFSPTMGVSFLFSNLALWGFPFMAGFYSSDLILEGVVMKEISWFIMTMLTLSILFTCMYSMRIAIYLIWGEFGAWSLNTLGETNSEYLIPFLTLGGLSLLGGSFIGWLIFSEPSYCFLILMKSLIPLGAISLGSALVFLFCSWNWSGKPSVVDFFLTMWYLTSLSSQWLINYFLPSGLQGSYLVDAGWTESLSGAGGLSLVSKMFYFVFLTQQNNFSILLKLMIMFLLLSFVLYFGLYFGV